MPHRQQKPSTQKQKNIPFSNFLPLIAVIRADLGADWAFYEEFLESVVDAAGRGEDSSAWYEQMEALVGDQVSLRFSHEGVCVLLRGLEGRAREDPTFHSEINKYFRPLETAYSTPDQAKHGVAETGDGYEEPAYFAEDDDLAVWRKHVEDGNWLL
ncbi:hypothetical protein IAQ61_000284 [Plenodomus lingam]|uniref:uncharacterized protein n=1 Tax=Leptosphaeria maculans TaxID=5022 RepID=UPI0033176430|nr:hypothetical protein IAQ61_000284 [Plenodomus lingam]